MSLSAGLAAGHDALVAALIEWGKDNPSADIRVWMLGLSPADRAKVRAAAWDAWHAPLGGWVTGP